MDKVVAILVVSDSAPYWVIQNWAVARIEAQIWLGKAVTILAVNDSAPSRITQKMGVAARCGWG